MGQNFCRLGSRCELSTCGAIFVEMWWLNDGYRYGAIFGGNVMAE
jgi:hypothetical protein